MSVFNEIQRFDQWWLKLFYVGLSALLMFGLYKWFIANENFGNVAVNDLTGQTVFSIVIVLVLLLFNSMKLRTSIDEKGIHYQFFPFHLARKTILWSAMDKCYIRKYNPISEYGGWGYRLSFGGKALNVKGNKGIQIKFKTGKKLLIGTQKEKEAAKIIERYLKKQL